MATTRTTKKTAAAEPARKPRESAAPSATHIAYKLAAGENEGDEQFDHIVDVVPFGHRESDEMTALRWVMGRGYFVATVPAGVSLREHLRTEVTS